MRRRNRSPEVMAISEHELTVMTRDLEQIHHDVGVPAMDRAINEWTERSRTSRRGFLIGAGALAGGAVLAACSSGSSNSTTTTSGSGSSGSATTKLTGDLAVAAVAASLENLAVAAYADVLTAAGAGKLGAVPPAVATFATTVKDQHAQHAQAWNSAITAAGHSAITTPDPVLIPVVTAAFKKVTNVTGAAKLALMLEDVAAATYQSAIGAVTAASSVKVAASIQPVEMQHAAILNFVLGQYPVPNAFSPLVDARPVSDYRG
ncbi:MAG TPA: ferritin-like domain-containing protein [Acidimicrobiales bacterium]|nr:ferritin-like domain-containing protein [Acidimicrobiales bacterium]